MQSVTLRFSSFTWSLQRQLLRRDLDLLVRIRRDHSAWIPLPCQLNASIRRLNEGYYSTATKANLAAEHVPGQHDPALTLKLTTEKETVQVTQTTSNSESDKENAWRFEKFISNLPLIQYPKRYKVLCTSLTSDANRYLKELTSVNHASGNVGDFIFGLDLEWRPQFQKGEKENPTALIQICGRDTILLLQMSNMKVMPKRLVEFLENPYLLKAGVNIRSDGLKLHRDFGIVTNGLLELSTLAQERNCEQLQRSPKRSLRALTGMILGRQMPKGKVRLSNWSRRFLTSKQIRYAANDAYASYMLAQTFHEMAYIDPEIKHVFIHHLKDELPPTPVESKLIQVEHTVTRSNHAAPSSTVTVIRRASSSEP